MIRYFLSLFAKKRPVPSRPIDNQLVGGPHCGTPYRDGFYDGEVAWLPSDPACREYERRLSRYRWDGRRWLFMGVVVVAECAGAGTRGGK